MLNRLVHPVRSPHRWRAPVEPLERRVLLAAELVADANPASPGSDPRYFTESGGAVYFSAKTGAAEESRELWKTDGTAEGTAVVKDIVPGPGGSQPTWLTDVAGMVYFFARDADGRTHLWKSDGTDAGTVTVADRQLEHAWARSAAHATSSGGAIYFIAADPADPARVALWRSDGTDSGTAALKSFPGSDQGVAPPSQLTDAAGTLFFVAADESAGHELWKSDGTAAGTVRVRDIEPGTLGSGIEHLTAHRGAVYFGAHTYQRPSMIAVRGLWKSDGTETGTVRLTSASSNSEVRPREIVPVGDTVYFTGMEPALGSVKLWKTNGTFAGTSRVPLPTGGPEGLVEVGGRLLFNAYGDLWRSDGTSVGTVRLVDDLGSFDLRRGGVVGNAAVFFVGASHPDLLGYWKTDGTAAGTARLKQLTPGSGTSDDGPWPAAGGKVFLSADDGVGGAEPWSSDGTAAGTAMVRDLYPTTYAAEPWSAVSVGDAVYFSGWVGGDSFSRTRWVFRAGPGGELERLWQGGGLSSGGGLSWLTPFQGALYFVGWNPSGTGLWKTDGTAAGTTLVKQVPTGPYGHLPAELTVVGDTLYFSAPPDERGESELWKSDGTEAGTVIVRDIFPGREGSKPYRLTAAGGLLYFVANDGTHGRELWRSDGTEQGTILLRDLAPGAGTSEPHAFTAFGNKVYFSHNYPGPKGLWATDGTPAGTGPVTGSDGPAAFATGGQFVPFGGALYFAAADANYNISLWKTDGTAEGTVKVLSSGHAITRLAATDHALFFAKRGAQGRGELWASDGTADGTRLLRDFPTELGNLTGHAGLLWFWGVDEAHGREPWVSDGTAAGTTLAADINPGPAPSLHHNPAIAPAGPGVYVAADHPQYGVELWRLDAPARVVARHVFYNRSSFDAYNPGVNPADDGAIAVDKVALLPGRTASFSNVTSYGRGINGLMIDISGGLPLTALAGVAAGLELRAGTGGDPAAWADAPRPSQVGIRPGAGAGGSDRITLVWPGGVIRNQWLQVTVKDPDTGFATADVFYFGSLVGDTGGPGMPRVDVRDLAMTRAAFGKTTAAALNAYDFNRDGVINAIDVMEVRRNQRRTLPLITAPAAPATGVGAAAAGVPVVVPPARGPVAARRGGILAEPPRDLLA